MGVNVEETRRDRLSRGVNLLGGLAVEPADAGNAAVFDPEVGPARGRAGSVDNQAVSDCQIIHCQSPPEKNKVDCMAVKTQKDPLAAGTANKKALIYSAVRGGPKAINKANSIFTGPVRPGEPGIRAAWLRHRAG